jgi:hypothetical protein
MLTVLFRTYILALFPVPSVAYPEPHVSVVDALWCTYSPITYSVLASHLCPVPALFTAPVANREWHLVRDALLCGGQCQFCIVIDNAA